MRSNIESTTLGVEPDKSILVTLTTMLLITFKLWRLGNLRGASRRGAPRGFRTPRRLGRLGASTNPGRNPSLLQVLQVSSGLAPPPPRPSWPRGRAVWLGHQRSGPRRPVTGLRSPSPSTRGGGPGCGRSPLQQASSAPAPATAAATAAGAPAAAAR